MSEMTTPGPAEEPRPDAEGLHVVPDEPAPTPGGISPLTQTALWVIVAALVLGGLGDWLLYGAAWGLNVTLWLLALVVATVAIVKGRGLPTPTGAPWVVIPLIGFALAYIWRDNQMLRSFDLFAVGVALTVPAWRAAAGSLKRIRLREIELGAVLTGLDAAISAIPLAFSDVKWGELRTGGNLRHVFALVWGLALALPLLLLFGGLFASADAGFEKLIAQIFNFNIDQVIAHLFVAGAIAWLVAGYLRGVITQPEGPPMAVRAIPWRLGIIEVATVLVLLDALFAVFVTMQLPYFFGGAEAVQRTAGLTYAEYARRGFFELMAVTGLVLPMLLVLHAFLGEENRRHTQVFRGLAGLMIVLVTVIVASAAHRMTVYQAEYGLTILRVYVLAFEVWLALALVWFAATVLRGRGDRFAFGLVVWGWVGLAALHLPDVEGAIVRHNVATAQAGKTVDAAYLGEMSSDAVPALVDAALDSPLPPADRAALAQRLLRDYGGTKNEDWRGYHWAQARARAIVGDKKTALEGVLAKATPSQLWPDYSR